METLKPKRLGHMVLMVRDIQASCRFYTEVLGLQVSDWIGDKMVFLRADTDHHDLALAELPADSPDRDDLPEPDPAWPVAPAVPGESIRDQFPAGALAGTCLHAMLERADFSRPLDVALARRCLGEAGLPTGLAPQVGVWLSEVLATALPGAQGSPIEPERPSGFVIGRCTQGKAFLQAIDKGHVHGIERQRRVTAVGKGGCGSSCHGRREKDIMKARHPAAGAPGARRTTWATAHAVPQGPPASRTWLRSA